MSFLLIISLSKLSKAAHILNQEFSGSFENFIEIAAFQTPPPRMSQGDWPNIQPLTTDRLFYMLVRALQRNRIYTHTHMYIYIYQFSSVTQSCLTLCDPMDCSKPGFSVHHQLPEFTQTHVRDAIQPSHPLSSPSPPALNLSQYQGLFQ